MKMQLRLLSYATAWALAALMLRAAPLADHWLTNAVWPRGLSAAVVKSNDFPDLRAEVAAGALQIKCSLPGQTTSAVLMVSTDAPGHWPSRDWRSRPMRKAGPVWLVEVPVESLHVPLIYFVTAHGPNSSTRSPMRIAFPKELGLEQPTQLFWAFRDGFESGLERWHGVEAPTRPSAAARSGKASLSMTIPEGRRSVSVRTPQLRGWLLQEQSATGIGLWLRATRGSGHAVFSISANAFTTDQVTARRVESPLITTNWSKHRLLLEDFPHAPLADLDLFTIEFTGEAGIEFLIDDLHLLGRWQENF